MKINKLLIFCLSLSLGQIASSQSLTEGDEDYVLPKDSITIKDRMDVSAKVAFGAGVSNNGSYLSTSVRPTVSYYLTPKFSVYTGIGYTNYQLENFNMLSDFGYQPFTGNLSQMSAFVGGKYQVNDRLAVYGEVFYNFAQITSANTNFNQGSTFDKIGYAASFEYKISDNMFIEGQIRINDFNRGSNVYDPFQDHGFGSGGFMRHSSGINTMPFSR
jgi:opacity protein-like surface antigen